MDLDNAKQSFPPGMPILPPADVSARLPLEIVSETTFELALAAVTLDSTLSRDIKDACL